MPRSVSIAYGCTSNCITFFTQVDDNMMCARRFLCLYQGEDLPAEQRPGLMVRTHAHTQHMLIQSEFSYGRSFANQVTNNLLALRELLMCVLTAAMKMLCTTDTRTHPQNQMVSACVHLPVGRQMGNVWKHTGADWGKCIKPKFATCEASQVRHPTLIAGRTERGFHEIS